MLKILLVEIIYRTDFSIKCPSTEDFLNNRN